MLEEVMQFFSVLTGISAVILVFLVFLIAMDSGFEYGKKPEPGKK